MTGKQQGIRSARAVYPSLAPGYTAPDTAPAEPHSGIRRLFRKAAAIAALSATQSLGAAASVPGFFVNPNAPTQQQVQSIFVPGNTLPTSQPDSAGLSFLNVVNKIVAPTTNPDTVTPQAVAFVQSLLDSFKLTTAVNVASGVSSSLTHLPVFSSMSAVRMLDQNDVINGMGLGGVMNRNDAASADNTSCGEGRLIYFLKVGETSPNRRFLIIFEAAQKPFPSPGPDGCFVYNDFWANKVGKETKVADIAADLKRLFITGLPTALGTLPPLVNANNYGLNGNPGQVRVNVLNPTDGVWRLRQFSVQHGTSNKTQLVLNPEPNANSPLPTYLKDRDSKEPKAVTTERENFWKFLNTAAISSLTAADMALSKGIVTTQLGLMQSLMIANAAPVSADGFESVSTPVSPPLSEDPRDIMSPTLQAQLTASLEPVNKKLIASGRASEVHLLTFVARENTSRCGGCHQEAGGQTIGTLQGGSQTSVQEVPFVNVDENSNPSGMLNPGLFMRRVNQEISYLKTHHLPKVNVGGSGGTISGFQTVPMEMSPPQQQMTTDDMLGHVPGAKEALQRFQKQNPPQNPDVEAAQERLALRTAREAFGIGLH